MSADSKGQALIGKLKKQRRVLDLYQAENRKQRADKEQALAQERQVLIRAESALQHSLSLQEQAHEQLEKMSSGERPYQPDQVDNLQAVLNTLARNIDHAAAERQASALRLDRLEQERTALYNKKNRLTERQQENSRGISKERDAMGLEEALEQQLLVRSKPWTS